LQKIFDPLPNIPEEYQKLIWKQNEIVYGMLLKRTKDLLHQGKNVVLDGTFSKRRLRSKVYSIAGMCNTNAYLIYCTCDEKIIEQRLIDREKEKGRLSNVVRMDLYYKVKENFEDPSNDGVVIVHYDSGTSKVEIWNKNLGKEDEIKTIVSAIVKK
jgi:predicted kinase